MTLPEIRTSFSEYNDLPVVLIRFGERMQVMSSCICNGGMNDTDTVAIMQVVPDYMHDDPRSDAQEMIRRLSLPEDTSVFMTAAEVKYVFSEERKECGGFDVAAFTTAGLSNQVVAGEPLTGWEERHALSQKRREALIRNAGTINVIGVSPEPLTDSGKVNSIIAMTEAKTAALNDLGYRETGTTSDAIAIICPENGNIQDYAGTGSDLGMALAQAVRSGVRKSLIKRNDFPVDMSEDEISELKRRYS